jgi:hypothetical protein
LHRKTFGLRQTKNDVLEPSGAANCSGSWILAARKWRGKFEALALAQWAQLSIAAAIPRALLKIYTVASFDSSSRQTGFGDKARTVLRLLRCAGDEQARVINIPVTRV